MVAYEAPESVDKNIPKIRNQRRKEQLGGFDKQSKRHAQQKHMKRAATYFFMCDKKQSGEKT